ncbi:acylphosphatase [Hyphococcus luteus]|uniref:acylphosphatase n=1 Tax=Hyphococcus luteus TaxID=2058213 RepID=A0A2S7K3F1_9PROT|nr:acylphosphatase [Marinicaulis flavus]PQA87032.1 acylphosphatase [Marinicaulis flavus]
MADKTVQVRITGRVQGVAYRAWTQDAARARRLSGWVRNCPDGAVEAVFSGPSEAVDAMLALCREGPPAARVDAVETEDAIAAQTDGEFYIRY